MIWKGNINCANLKNIVKMNSSTIKEITNLLERVNICSRCILRFCGIKEYTSYKTKSAISKTFDKLVDECSSEDKILECEDLKDSNNDLCPPVKRFLPSPCASCIGILQNSCDEMLSKIQVIVKERNHQFDDFVLQLSIPVVIDLRDKIIFTHLKEKLQNSYTVDISEIPTVKDVCKWVIGPQFGKITGTDFTPYSDFQISIFIAYPDIEEECKPLFEVCPDVFTNGKKRFNFKNLCTRPRVLKAMDSASSEFTSIYKFPPAVPVNSCSYEVQLNHSPIYLGGRYNKYSRELSQTPWFVGDERHMDSSVNELITDIIQKWIKCDKIVFSASGREDVDVKMLGNGRPFVLEVFNPRKVKWKKEEMEQMQNEINESTKLICVEYLQMITKKDTLLLKEGEEQKKKCYSALCFVKKGLSEDDKNKLENLRDLKLSQKTPIRVLHRRSLATRERLLHSIKAEILEDNKLRLHLEAQAGTYIKEFVHGDFGRTVPSLGTLLNTEADILELDVESIELEWPPPPS